MNEHRTREFHAWVRARRRRKRRHALDIPDRTEHPWRWRWLAFRWRLALASVAYPIQLALAVALAVCAIPVTMLVNQGGVIQRQQGQITGLVKQIQISRAAAVQETCGKINRTTTAVNAEIGYLRGLILNGAKSTRAFEKTFRELGLPPYRVRLAQAQRQADGLNRFALTPLDCRGLTRTVKRQTPPPPKVPQPTTGR